MFFLKPASIWLLGCLAVWLADTFLLCLAGQYKPVFHRGVFGVGHNEILITMYTLYNSRIELSMQFLRNNGVRSVPAPLQDCCRATCNNRQFFPNNLAREMYIWRRAETEITKGKCVEI